jgi:hypothetical protein
LLAARTTNEENQHRHAGGGFAGLSALMYLDKTLAGRAEAEITLISRKKLFCSLQMLPRLPPKPGFAINSNECESD